MEIRIRRHQKTSPIRGVKPAVCPESISGRKSPPSAGHEVILAKVGYLPPLKPPPVKNSCYGKAKGGSAESSLKMRREVARTAIMANSIEELGVKMKLPVKTFKATIKRYNELARLGKDLDFGKRPDRLSPIDTPPFYAGRSGWSLLAGLG